MKKFFTLFVSLIVCLSGVFADYNAFGVPDSAEIRKELPNEWFEAPIEIIRTFETLFRTNNIGLEFKIAMEETEKDFTVYVSPRSEREVTIFDDKGSRVQKEIAYPSDSYGSWVLVRNKVDGSPIVIRYFFSKDANVYVQFRPNKNTTFADLVIDGAFVVRSVPIGSPISTFYKTSFLEVQSLTKNTLPWNYVTVNPGLYGGSKIMIDTIRKALPNVVYIDDAMYNEYGEPITIVDGKTRIIAKENEGKLTLSSAGFVKWVVDGLITPYSGGTYLRREPLIEPTTVFKNNGFRGTVSRKYSIMFGLDWTRNLAAAALSVSSGKTILYKDSGVDIKIEPFTSVITENGIQNTYGYIKDTGYKASNLNSILYVLATTEPNNCYLAAIQQTDTDSLPEVRFFNECAVIFPYFDKDGCFQAVVFINGKEMTLSSFIKTVRSNGDCFVHLTRVKCSQKYYPQEK